jgi:hypothetical protein
VVIGGFLAPPVVSVGDADAEGEVGGPVFVTVGVGATDRVAVGLGLFVGAIE